MNDRDFLLWIAARLVGVHGENQEVDYIGKLVSIAAATPLDQRTPNTKNYATEMIRNGVRG